MMIGWNWQKLGLAAAILSVAPVGGAVARDISIAASDGVQIFGDYERAKGADRGTILLFHMAGSNREEYAPIAPVLNAAGFATLAIDQRAGGTLWGRKNQTVENARRPYSYADVVPDLEAAITFAKHQSDRPILLWGSSYSAALVFLVAARHPEVRALLAFSPGEYIEGASIGGAAASLSIPVFITSTPDQGESDAAKKLAAAVPAHNATQFIPQHGVHGSATLRTDENGPGQEVNWKHVTDFLNRVSPR